jgi:hypothetical protein
MSSENTKRNTYTSSAHRLLAACLLAAASWLTAAVPATAQTAADCVRRPVPNIKFSTLRDGNPDYGFAKSEKPAKILGPLKFKIFGHVVNGRLKVEGDIQKYPLPTKRNAFQKLLFSYNGNYGVSGKPTVSYCVAPTYRMLTIRGVTGTEHFAQTSARYEGPARAELIFSDKPGEPDKFRLLISGLKLSHGDKPNPEDVGGEVFRATLSKGTNLDDTLLP